MTARPSSRWGTGEGAAAGFGLMNAPRHGEAERMERDRAGGRDHRTREVLADQGSGDFFDTANLGQNDGVQMRRRAARRSAITAQAARGAVVDWSALRVGADAPRTPHRAMDVPAATMTVQARCARARQGDA